MSWYDDLKNGRGQIERGTHYYGDLVRKLFIVAGMIMIIGLPIFKDSIPFPIYSSILGILIIGLLAGWTNPVQKWISMADIFISLIGLIIFEYYAIIDFQNSYWIIFPVDQLLAIIFFFSIYYGTKSLRGFLVK